MSPVRLAWTKRGKKSYCNAKMDITSFVRCRSANSCSDILQNYLHYYREGSYGEAEVNRELFNILTVIPRFASCESLVLALFIQSYSSSHASIPKMCKLKVTLAALLIHPLLFRLLPIL